ncbi:hypothetical protein [Spiroplasma endosymbiont of Labia minor]|uniref:hypothetical protein n=1 Tax=Spiroplasma endosymbiont of Labia minor TaxID=3066305 RepID=UPI0030D3CFA7
MNYQVIIGFGLVFVAWFFIITLFVRNTLLIRRTNVLPINSADDNISTSRIQEIISKAKMYFNISHVNVIYAESNNISLMHSYDRKNNKLLIPKILFSSVGYEIDWILGYMWYASKIIHKNKQFILYNSIYKFIIPILFSLLLIVSGIAIIIVGFYISNPSFYADSDELQFLFKYQVFSIISLILCMIYFLLVVAPVNWKENMEFNFESEIRTFINNVLSDFKTDFIAARQFAHEIKQFYLPSFIKTNKVSDYKYLGVFSFH